MMEMEVVEWWFGPVIAHADQIDRYGGAPGARDMRLLEAALFRPDAP
jgi:hypothetical protein